MIAAAGGADRVAGAADALHAARDRRRRLDLDDEVDRAHVDAELERRGGDQAADVSGLQPILDLDALRPRERSVVRADEHLPGQLVERRGQPLGDPPAVDEDQRRAVRADQLEQPRMDRRPDRVALRAPATRGPLGISSGWPIFAMSSTGTSMRRSSFFFSDVSTIVTGRYVGDRGLRRRELVVDRVVRLLDRACALCRVPGFVGGLRFPAAPLSRIAPPPRNRATSSSGRCVADSPMRWMRCRWRPGRAAQQLFEPLERQRQVRAALGRHQRVDLVDDDRVDRAQRLAGVRGQQQIERLGRRDQDVGRLAQEPRALDRRACRRSGWRPSADDGRRRAATRGWRCRPAARAGCARCRPPAPSAARCRARGSAVPSAAPGRTSAG